MKAKDYFWMAGAFIPFILFLYFGYRADSDPTWVPLFAKNNEFLIEYWYLIFVLIWFAIVFFFIWHAFTNEKLSEKEKYGWAVGMIIFSGLLNMVYWWQHIKPPPNKSLQSDAPKARR